jgi:nickel/cobalt transporter (NicO) family protein
LLVLGLSAGIVPCPAALVLLLSAIALGNPLSGLVLVVVFSLGLSLVLTALGLSLVYAKQLFQRWSLPKNMQQLIQQLPGNTIGKIWLQRLPMISAVVIVAIGLGISTQALLKVF